VEDYTRVNLKSDVKDMAPEYDMKGIESRFARTSLELAHSGLSYFRLDPGYRAPFGHTHSEQEEVYVIVGGSGRVKVDDDVHEIEQWDAVRVSAGAMRNFEAGADGLEYVAFGAPNTGGKDVEMVQGWWPEEE
jgi:uncharacterized cupin superfamily protein